MLCGRRTLSTIGVSNEHYQETTKIEMEIVTVAQLIRVSPPGKVEIACSTLHTIKLSHKSQNF